MSTDNEQMDVAGIEIEVVRKDIKNMHLAVYPPNGRVRIASPLRMGNESLRLFAISKLSWIKKQQKKFKDQPRETPREYVTGESHYYQGKRYLLNVMEVTGATKVVIRNKKYIDFYVPAGSSIQQREQVLKEWHRQQLKVQVPTLLHKWEKLMGVEAHSWGIKQMRTKWGTCNIEARRIWLNLELSKKPTICLEYIIVHELVHLLERTHNDTFVAYMDKFMPGWLLVRAKLNSLPVRHEWWGY